MKSISVRTDEERAVLTALIVNHDVLGVIHTKLGEDKRPFENKWANTICGWCRAYYTKYQKAPRKHIRTLFTRQAERIQDEDAVALIETFLARLSKDYEASAKEMNEKFIIDQASAYFERVRLSRYTDALQQAVENKDLEEARTQIAEYKTLDFSSTAWTDPLHPDTIKQTLRYFEKDRTLIQFPSALGKFLSPHFGRDAFIAFQAPEKRGKSFWLLETVYQALKQRRKVLYYVLGDMSLDQANRRLYSRLTRMPNEKQTIKRPVELLIKDHTAKVKIETELRTAFTIKDVLHAKERLLRATSYAELPLKVKCEGASVVSASDIERDVSEFAQKGWVPDVVVVDYFDLLDSEPHTRTQDFRHQVNESWKVIRRISLNWHCLVVGATQANAGSYDGKTMRKKDFSEDKRKNAHVTGLVGINQTSEEKLFGVYRLNWVFLRDGAWADTQTVWTAGNLAIASPAIISTF